MLAVASVQVAPLISFTTKVGKLHPPLILIDQTKADQIGQVARRQMLRLRNTRGDAAEADFFARTEWCPKTTFHSLPPKLMFGGKLGRKSVASHRPVRIRTVALPASLRRLVAAKKRPARN